MSREHDQVSRLWRSVLTPSSDELRELARAAAAESQRVEPQPTRRRRPRARWAVAVGAVALLIGSGLGFGLGTSVTPSGTASRNVVGFGFLPERGWNVVQTAGPGPGATTATASRDGIVLSVTSTPRGDPAEDVRYGIRELPLQVADARPSSADPSGLELRAGVGGYNIDARIQFEDAMPSAAMHAATQRQLDRLVVAADRVTMAVRPAISSRASGFVTAFGTIDSGKAGESVTIQTKECDNSFFRVFAGANTEAGGSWSTYIFPSVTMTLRAVWNGDTSNEVVFRQRAFVNLYRQPGSASRFRVFVGAARSLPTGKPVTIQRFDQRLGKWETVRRVPVGQTPTGTRFTLRVPKGTRLRAVFPTSLARPCYLGGTSPVIRT